MAAPTPATAFPLTTVFSASEGCPTIIDLPSKRGCQPRSFFRVWDGHYYSPGICMDGYTIGCVATGTTANGVPIAAGETVGFCVPSGYDCSPDKHTITDGSQTGVTEWTHWAETTLDTPKTSGTSVISASAAFAFQVRWKSSDLSILETSPVLPSISPMPSSSSMSMPTPTLGPTGDTFGPTNHPVPSATPSGLSAGSIAGIAVGAVCFALLMITVAVFIFRRRRREAREFPGRNLDHGDVGTPELDGSALNATHAHLNRKHLPPAPIIHEKGLEQDPQGLQEMDSAGGRAELDVLVQGAHTSSDSRDPNSEMNRPVESINAQAGPAYIYPQEVSAGWSSPKPENNPSPGGNVHDPQTINTGTSSQDVAELLERQAKIQERRQRLLELDRLDREEEELQRRIRESRQ
ncbi:hypothetical protein V8F20_005351 [Naviculisporaceae sp. PSN 640]